MGAFLMNLTIGLMLLLGDLLCAAWWLTKVLFCLLVMALGLASMIWMMYSYHPAFGQRASPHSQFHAGVYDQWQTIIGGSCCNDNDCRGAQAWRLVGGGYEVLDGDKWLAVPPQAIRPYASPDGNAHVCISNGQILCFVRGSEA